MVGHTMIRAHCTTVLCETMSSPLGNNPCLSQIDDGIAFAKRMVEEGDDSPLLARGFIALGIGLSLKAEEVKLQVQRQDYQRKALNAFIR